MLDVLVSLVITLVVLIGIFLGPELTGIVVTGTLVVVLVVTGTMVVVLVVTGTRTGFGCSIGT